mmetsp:Transcript_46385/g.75710  ORF Transcript_46385/g.75710 Transcript_46385/m.75710 type:complete len:87 (+) Transcript_46385:71-331(+)
MATTELKKQLRREIRARIRSMSSKQLEKEEAEVAARVLASDAYRKSKDVSVYIHMPGELSTEPILKDLLTSAKCFRVWQEVLCAFG